MVTNIRMKTNTNNGKKKEMRMQQAQRNAGKSECEVVLQTYHVLRLGSDHVELVLKKIVRREHVSVIDLIFNTHHITPAV